MRLRQALAAVLFLGLPTVAHPACDGADLIAALEPAQRAALDARAQSVPYPRGNLWQARRDDTILTIVGTFHVGDPRMQALTDRLEPKLRDAELVLVEITPAEEARMAGAMANTPSLGFITEGPTLRDMLSDGEWADYAREMSARGVPAAIASRFRPWLAFTTLSIPACILDMPGDEIRGLDDRLIEIARDAGIPVRGLERFEEVLAVFDSIPEPDQMDILRTALIQAEASEDMFATLANAYFAGEHRLIWEFSRSHMPEPAQALFPPERIGPLFDRLETALLVERNRAWMARLLPEVEGRRAMVAVGAAHLSGHDGLLDLLSEAGFSLTRLDDAGSED